MSAEDILKQAALDILEDIGVDAEYFIQSDLTTVSCKVNVDVGVDLQPSGDSQVWERATTIEYALEEVGREADVGDTFTIESIVYTVKAVLENDGYFVKVAVI